MRLTAPQDRPTLRIPTVGTTRTDLDAVREELRATYSGALCVYRVPRSQGDLNTAYAQLLEIIRRHNVQLSYNADMSPGAFPRIDYVTTTLVVNVDLLTPGAAAELAPLAPALTLTASIEPNG